MEGTDFEDVLTLRGNDLEVSNSAANVSDGSSFKKKKGASKPGSEFQEHKQQLERLKEKDPEFYEFLKEHDKELLNFGGEETDAETEVDEAELENGEDELVDQVPKERASKKTVTSELVDSWCKSIEEDKSLGATRQLLRAYRTACHYGDDQQDDQPLKLTVMSSSVFNKIMTFVLSKIDGVFRSLLGLPVSGGKKETVLELMDTKAWSNYGYLVKSYLSNSLYVLQQMTDTEMISFTLQRLRPSVIFLAAFPSLLRRYIKVGVHFWGTGKGALPVVSFFLIRDLCVRLGSDCLDQCLRGIYKAYVLNCQFVSATKLQHIDFLGNCVAELYGVDLSNAYEHAFIFIRQLGMVLRNALTVQNKESYRKVYEWKFLNCLELWTKVVCAYKDDPDFEPLAYPLTQIISGTAQLVPTAKYFPLRLRCTKMLNQIAVSTRKFIPISSMLVDMLGFKVLNSRPTGGPGKAMNLYSTLKISKQVQKTRSFQDECFFSVIEQLTDHLAQWSYSVFFYELAFLPLSRLRQFCKATKSHKFGKEVKQLVVQIEANIEFINKRRASVTYSANDQAAIDSFLEADKEGRTSPLSQFVVKLRSRAQQRKASMVESSVLVGKESYTFAKRISDPDDDNVEDGDSVFNSNWLPMGVHKESKKSEPLKKKKRQHADEAVEAVAVDEDVVTELEFSSDEDEMEQPASHSSGSDEDEQLSDAPETANDKRRNKTSFHQKSQNKRKTPGPMKKKHKPKFKNAKRLKTTK